MLLTSCRKDKCFLCDPACKKDHELPQVTQLGKDVLGFLKKGEVWINYGNTNNIGNFNLYCNKVNSSYSNMMTGYENFYLSTCRLIKCKGEYKVYDGFQIQLNQLNNTGYYILDSIEVRSIKLQDNVINKSYVSNFNNPATINITKLDTINKIISGTFSGYLFNENNLQDSIHISQGRFDVKYY